MVYLFLILFILISSMFIKSKKTYCFYCTLLIILIVGLRNYELGLNDTTALYIPYFKYISKLNFQQLLSFIKTIDTEYGFYIMSFIISKFTTNITLYLLVISTITYGLLGKFIYKYSKYPNLSFIILISLNYFGYGFYMLRHMMALSILTLSYDYLIKDNKIKFLIFTILASLFHRSAIIFLLILFIFKIKVNKKLYIPITFIIIVLIKLFGSSIMDIVLNNIFDGGHFAYYSLNGRGDTITLLLINVSLLMFLTTFFNKNITHEVIDYKCQIIAVILSAFVLYLSEFMRLASFFSIYTIASVPNSIHNIKDGFLRKNFYVVICVIMITYFFLFSSKNNNINVYKFFWEV